MLRYYMTPETQQALIAESNRQIARRTLSRHSATRRNAYDLGDRSEVAARDGDAANDTHVSVEDSAFGRLVAELQAVSAVTRSQ